MNLKNSLIIIAAFASLCFSCKGTKGDPGPIGEKGMSGSNGSSYDDNFSEGYIKGIVTGTGPGGNSFSIPFNLTEGYLQSDINNTYTRDGAINDSILIRLSRFNSMTKDSLQFGHIDMFFTTKSLTTKESLNSNSSVIFDFRKREKDGKIYTISQYTSGLRPSPRFTKLNYDSLTGILTGNFEANIKNFDLSNSHLKGSFSCRISQVVNYRK